MGSALGGGCIVSAVRAPRETDDIAVVGMSCRFPGAPTIAAFWELLRTGVDAIRDFPQGRYDLDAVYDPDPARAGKLYVRQGGFIDGIDGFDAGFFGISPREAAFIDPQHRLLLETAVEALDDAGLPLESVAGNAVGTFVGISTHDYGDIQMYPGNRALISSHSNSGTATSIAANRISYLLDLRGPSLTVDTACSSALTAVHLAVQSLRRGECRLAIVGGSHLLLTPEPTIGFCKASMLSPNARCKAFSAAADGYVRSEGVGAVVLKPLADAQRDGDSIYAVVRGTAINQDGRTVGMTVPSEHAQAAMLRSALHDAGLEQSDVQYIEAHGTGTQVGDPIEARAIGSAYGEARAPGAVWAIGSVKSNIGHLEAASGIAGFIKTALALAHRQIPPSLHFNEPNPDIDFDALGLRVVTKLEEWPAHEGAAAAGINSFGFGGANAHVVMQEGPRASPDPVIARALPRPELLLLSARSAEALTATAQPYADLLASENAPALDAMCANAAVRRSAHPFRAALVASSDEDFIDALDALAAAEQRSNVVTGRAGLHAPKTAFVFSGMGAQYARMGSGLLASEPAFRDAIERCDAIARPLTGWSVREALEVPGAASRVADADYAMVTNFAVQMALYELWRSWGIVPDATLGHSGGAIAAAYASGVHTLEDAVMLAFHRGRLQSRLAGLGTMLAVALSQADADAAIGTRSGLVSIGAINSPASCTLTGDAGALEEIRAELEARGVFARMVGVTIPYHSAAMDPVRAELLDALGPLKAFPARTSIVSDVTGAPAEGTTYDAEYWWRALRLPVQFAAGVDALIDAGCTTFLEIGPHPVLGTSLRENVNARGIAATILPSLRRNDDDRAVMLRSLGALWTLGHPIDSDRVFGRPAQRVALPAYPWQRERAWYEPAARSTESFDVRVDPNAHPLLGSRAEAPTPRWDARINDDARRWLDDHVVSGTIVYPGAAYLEMALAAVREASTGSVTLRAIDFTKALFMVADVPLHLHSDLDIDGSLRIYRAPISGQPWALHAQCRITSEDAAAPESVDRPAIAARCSRFVSVADLYERFAERGLAYGPAFRGIVNLLAGTNEAIGEISSSGLGIAADAYAFHPALLDAAFQVLIAAAETPSESPAKRRQLFLPVHVDRFTFYRSPEEAFESHARVVRRDEATLIGDIDIFSRDGALLASVRGLRCQELAIAAVDERAVHADERYVYDWEPAAPIADPQRSRARIDSGAALSVAQLMPAADERARTTGWARYYTEAEPVLDARAATLAHAAFVTLGCDAASFATVEPEALFDRLGIVASARGLARRLFAHAADAIDANAARARLVALDDTYGIEMDLLERAGAALPAILRGEDHGQRVLFSGDGAAQLTRFYREGPASRFYHAVLADALAGIERSRRSDEPLRIVEVGGGTAGCTAAIVAALESRPYSYTFSDVSPYFLSQAQREFIATADFTTRIFDVEQDPLAQGFTPGNADMVVAANVIHGTADLAQTLSNARALLAPGGLLVLLEITRRPLWLDVVFGVTEGWWKFRDFELRPEHPLLDADQWLGLLNGNGFRDAVALSDTASGGSGQTIFFAHADAGHGLGSAPRRWIIHNDARDTGSRLARQLRALGCAVRLEATSAGVREALAAEQDESRPPGVVDLRWLDAREPTGESGADVVDAQAALLSSALELDAVESSAAQGPRWFVTATAQHAGDSPPQIAQASLWGLVRVMMRERLETVHRLVDLDAGRSDEAVAALARELHAETTEEEIALRRDMRFVRRLRRAPRDVASAATAAVTDEPTWRIAIATPGAFETIAAVAAPRKPPAADELEIAVAAAGLNFRDVMLAAGMIGPDATSATYGKQGLGLDCAGYVVRCGSDVEGFAPGDAVVGIAPDALASFATTKACLVAPMPEDLSLADAAALPCAFVTASYALEHLARLRAGERVLIHAATGGVGLAALQIAQVIGAEIWATAGSPAKRAYLHELGAHVVMDSRSLAFADEILARTDGEGVDVILNSLAGEAIPRGIEALRPYGRFVELGKRDIYSDSKIGLFAFRKNLSFFAVDLDRLCSERPAFAGAMLRETVDRIASGAYRPLPVQSFEAGESEAAIRFMAQARHMGKIVIHTIDSALRVRAADDAAFGADGTYLISGGLGGFGLATAEWLATRGCRSIVLVGRSAPNPQTAARIDALRGNGVDVRVRTGDVANGDDVTRVVDEIRSSMAPLRGVVHAAMVLDDAALDQLTPDRLRSVLAPKMAGAWNLHRATLDDQLDAFICYSSLTSILGNPLQGNYAAANAFVDAFCSYRQALGLPGLSINWGPLSDVGYVAQHPELSEYLERNGYAAMTAGDALDALSEALTEHRAQLTVARIDWQKLAAAAPATAAAPGYEHLRHTATLMPSAAPGSVRALLDAAVTTQERSAVIETFLRDKVGRVLGVNSRKVDAELPLSSMGLDSLLAVELVTVIKLEVGVDVPIVKMLQGITLNGLVESIAVGSGASTNGVAHAAAPPPPADAPGPEHSSRSDLPAALQAVAAMAAPTLVSKPEPASRPSSMSDSAAAAPHAGETRYAGLPYDAWSPLQRTAQSIVRAGFRLTTNLDIEGVERIPRIGGVIVAVNHLSLADVPLVLSILPRPAILLAAEWLRASLPMRWFLGTLGNAIFVERGTGDAAAVASALDVLRSGGILGISPEGTRSRTGGLAAAHTGVAYLATMAHVPVLPIASWGHERITSSLRRGRRQQVHIRVGEPIAVTGEPASARDLRNNTDTIMLALAALLPPEYRGVYSGEER